MNSNEMIDRYVNEVGGHLPHKTRMDIEMELRSLLHDALDAQSDGEPTPKMTAAMLRDFGSPQEIAARYRPDEVLIGTQLFPVYRQVVTIVLAIIGVLYLVLFGLLLWQGERSIVDAVVNLVFAYGRSALISAGIVTIIFAAIERLAGDSLNIPQQDKAWDPFALPPVNDPDRVNRGELLVEIVITLFFVGWFSTATNWFNPNLVGEEATGIMTLISPQVLQFIPWLIGLWVMEIVLKTAVFIQSRWQKLTRWLELGLQGFSFYVLYQIYLNGNIFTVAFFNSIAKTGLAIILLIVVLDMIGKLARLLFGRPFSPKNIFKSKLA